MSDRFPPEVRYAKHRMLAEIGASGQARLCASRFDIDEDDPAACFAAMLLERSGLARARGAPRLALPDARCGDEAYAEVDQALRGSIAALEAVREIVGAGRGRPPLALGALPT